MFGQNHDQQSQDDQNNFNQPIDPSAFGAPAPAPGAPAGPISGDDTPAQDGASWADNLGSSAPSHDPLPNDVPSDVPADELLDIKQDALQELTPLVGHLEQSPEEKFKTTMMMIQATDDHSLIKSAYDTAKQIADEKARAQALLDVVNEINYFTQNHHN